MSSPGSHETIVKPVTIAILKHKLEAKENKTNRLELRVGDAMSAICTNLSPGPSSSRAFHLQVSGK